MICPKCQQSMEVVSFNDIDVDRCSGCQGIWFDFREQDELKKLKGAEAIDVGDKVIGAKYDKIRDVSCPKCEVPLYSVVHNGGDEIRFERCTNCKGSFFDAGEFTRYVADEIFDEFEGVMSELGNLESGQNLVDS